MIMYSSFKSRKKYYAITLSGFASIAAIEIVSFLKINNYPIGLIKIMIYSAMLIPLITYLLSYKYEEKSVNTAIISTVGVFAFNFFTIISM